MWLLLILLITYSYAFIMATTTDSNNLGECQALVFAVTSTRRLQDSASSPGSPAIFCDLGVHFPFLRSYDSVFIYGVVDPAEQDPILANLRSHHAAAQTTASWFASSPKKIGGHGRIAPPAAAAGHADRKLRFVKFGSNKQTPI